MCHTATATVTGRKQSFYDACGIDFPSESAPHCAGSDLRERHFYIGSDVEDGGDCSVIACKDAPLEPANERSTVMCSLFDSCFDTKPHRWHGHRRHLGPTFAVPGRSRPGPQLRRVIPWTSPRERRRRFRTSATDVSAQCTSCHSEGSLSARYAMSSTPCWRGASGVARSFVPTV